MLDLWASMELSFIANGTQCRHPPRLLYPLYTFYFVRKYKGQMPYYPGDGQE
ncbi:unnamed protein product, partial [Symbiodinium necroappetens]